MKTNLDPQTLLNAAQKAPDTSGSQNDRKKLKKSCQDFEAIFVQSLFKAMRKTVPEGELFKNDNAVDMFQEMIDQEIATNVSRKQSIGLAEQMYRQIEQRLPYKK